MDKTLATLVKTLATRYAGIITEQRFNGLAPRVLHMRSLRKAADDIIADNINTLSKTPDSK